jgi:Na+/melibiose symporter-like transporter
VGRIGLLYAALPAGLILAAAAAALPYRIGRRETAAIQLQLDQQRARMSYDA